MNEIYFAYGSNMSSERFFRRINKADFLDIGYITDHILLFNKKSIRDDYSRANIKRSPGHNVWGVLYTIDSRCIAKLDLIEGGYDRETFNVNTNNEKIEAIAYISNQITPNLPHSSYLEPIINGALEHNLPEDYLDFIKNIKTNG